MTVHIPAEERTERLPVWNDSGRVLQVNEIFYSIEGRGPARRRADHLCGLGALQSALPVLRH